MSDAARLREHLVGTSFGDVTWVANTGSTNSDAMAMARSGAPSGSVVVADHQDAGRGRLGRSWTAPPGASLLVSVLVRPALTDGAWGLYPLAAGLSVAEAADAATGCALGVKWPNDIVTETSGGRRKVGGVLCETDVVNGEVIALVIGFGLNVNWPATLPDELVGIATSLNVLANAEFDRVVLLAPILRNLERRLGQVTEPAERGAFLEAYRSRCRTIGEHVRVVSGDVVTEGIAERVTDDGSLLVHTAAGELSPIRIGDVHGVQAAP